MIYMKVYWKHSDDDYPIEIYSELDKDRYEVRKIEIFSNGKVNYAQEDKSTGSTILGEVPVPPINEINGDAQFEAAEITQEEFNSLWLKYFKL
ncbi:DUF6881 domain-containing protein [Xenorhabdus griffiniae]|uniref:DUF6881 domain-containing protein n=1 Tax=Xenorhabdus griffiniae TaxID=351672 RepID=A0ABY9XIN0_9GAMM|nr:hypothetical protein [Xenorhabdus griffiniae]MBD1227946.1 hypothetical protein [Xenorhabdus griffiniae]MBE8588372.1 hypothetical protein [Xenorhabdus griffiniae]WMV72250.1 hypothetical protein QL128_19515 [Xenorhabdus griffiniae]WMV72748.1 hypothetical protein QL128_01365 [Xenorhabdus griffiniae]WNH01928.1 hypothetical protein QL112_019525 [Xenorhabdus griffiniae]